MTDYDESWDREHAPDASTTEDPPPRPNFFQRMWLVIVRPGELFEALAPNPAWFPMAAFVGLLVGISFFLTPVDAFFESFAATTTPEQRGDIEDTIPFIKLMWVAVAALVSLVFPVILGALTYVIFVFMRGDRSTFKQHLCVISHTGVISAVGAFVALPLRIINVNAQENLSLADLAPFLEGFWFNLLNAMDLFAIWACLVAGIGLSALDPRRRWGPTATILIGILVFFALLGATLTSMFTP
jgi:hypothetical protein